MTRPKEITAPGDTSVILDWYAGHHEAVFCLLHPFARLEEPKDLFIFEREDGPTRDELRRLVSRVRWSEIVDLAQLDGLGMLNRLLLEWSLAVTGEHQHDLRRLQQLLHNAVIRDPDCGEPPDLILDDLLNAFSESGYSQIYVGDEFGLEAKLYEISELLSWKFPVVGIAHPSLYSKDQKLVCTAHWDSVYSCLCGARKHLEEIVLKFNFEGFFCDQKTKVYWGKGLGPVPENTTNYY